MNEFYKFYALCKKYRLTLIIVPVITIIITFFLVRNLSDTYTSQAQLSTGIADDKQSTVFNEVLPGDQVNQEFANLIEMVRMKRVLHKVSYLLIINDLASDKPFKEPSKLMTSVNEDAKRHALEVLRKKYELGEPLDPKDPDQKGMIDLINSMGYDIDNIDKGLQIFRSGGSDFLIIQSEAESPELSAFIANSVSTEFIKNYSNVVKLNQTKANNFLGEVLLERTDTLSKRMSDLRNYKIKYRVLNLDEQSKQLYTSIIEYDNQKQAAIQNTASYAGALNEIERKFNPNERKYLEATESKVNAEIIAMKNEISGLYEAYLNSDFEPRYRSSMDSLKNLLDEQILKSSDQYLSSPLATKQQLVSEKIRLEVQLDLSRFSINALETKLNQLNAKFDTLVPKEAEVQTLEMKVDIATKAYIDILDKYNTSSLQSAFAVKLNIIQPAVPGNSKPSKKMLLVILSGIISFGICLVFIFLIYYLDNTIISPKELADRTTFPVFGNVNLMSYSHWSLKKIWDDTEVVPDLMVFKNQLRSVRYEIEKELNGGKVLMITSLSPLEGKGFICMNISVALMLTFKKVLIIDGNFMNSEISNLYTSGLYLEDFLNDKIDFELSAEPTSITILKNRGGDNSLMEIATAAKIQQKLDSVKHLFDFIIIDTASIGVSNQPKEWSVYADGIVGVFKHGKVLNATKINNIKFLKETGLFKGWILNQVPS